MTRPEYRTRLPTPEESLPGRDSVLYVEDHHAVFRRSLVPPFPTGSSRALFGMGCFWGAERCFWSIDGVYITAVGYSGGFTPNPHYEEVCTGRTGHNETVLVVYEPDRVDYLSLLKRFWESHDPTQGMRQGNDLGTQYRSGIYCFDDTQSLAAEQSRADYQHALSEAGRGTIKTGIEAAGPFYYAESHHQQYLAKHPGGYCGLGGTGIPYQRP